MILFSLQTLILSFYQEAGENTSNPQKLVGKMEYSTKTRNKVLKNIGTGMESWRICVWKIWYFGTIIILPDNQ
jgi:hypothetical protein